MDWKTSEDRLRQLNDLIREMDEASSDGAVIVVEGKRDEEALRSLGVTGRFLRLSGAGRPIADLAAEIHREADRAVMALDWDSQGAKLEVRFAELLERFCVDVDRETRIKMGALVRKDITDVESLPTLLRSLERERLGAGR